MRSNQTEANSEDESDSEEDIGAEAEITANKTIDSNSSFNVQTKIILPEIGADRFPFLIETLMPTCGSVTESLTIVYKICNKTNSYLDIECSLEQNEYFAFAGKKMVKMDYSFKLFQNNNPNQISLKGINSNIAS